MADYIRFEIDVPVYYSVVELDPEAGVPRPVTHQVAARTIKRFVDATLRRFQGITRSNPAAAAPYMGWWKPTGTAEPVVDHLIFLFGLVPVHRLEEAVAHFTTWKRTLERATNQEVILVIYYPVQTIGDFF